MAASYSFGPFVLDTETASLKKADVAVALRPKAFDALCHLVANASRLLSKDDLVAAVWPDTIVNDDALAQCIRDIRRAIGDDSKTYIRTVPRRGYLFVAEAVALGAAASDSEPGPARNRLTIAVLPLSNLGGADDWLAEGLTEDITAALARFRELAVISSNSAFHADNFGTDLPETGRKLGADFLVRGSIRRKQDALRITIRLVDVRSGATRWAAQHDRRLPDILVVDEEIATRIVAHLVAEAREAVASRADAQLPSSLEAYELVLRARKAYRTYDREQMHAAGTLLEQAIARDPHFAAAWELLARLRLQFYIQPFDLAQWRQPNTLDASHAAAHRAVALDPGFSTARATAGTVLLWKREHDHALTELRRALDLNPSDTTTLGLYADALCRAGLHRRALAAYDEARRLDPFPSPIASALEARTHNLLGEFEAAHALARASVEAAPNLLPGLIQLTIAAMGLGREAEARATAARLLVSAPFFTVYEHFALIGHRDPADTARQSAPLIAAGLPEGPRDAEPAAMTDRSP